MEKGLDLSLPKRETPAPRKAGPSGVVVTLLLAAVLLNLGVSIWNASGFRGGTRPAGVGLAPATQKDLALKLEQQGLRAEAVEAWKQYLDAARPSGEDAARIWYRIGTLFQDDHDYARALDGYYRSERFAKVSGLDAEIGRRIQDCLEGLGRFAALRYELEDRVSLSGTGTASEVVAEIGAQKITRRDLDERIEQQIGQQLSQYRAMLPPGELDKQKEALLKQFSSSSQRLRLLNQFVLEEILYRKARESKLTDDPAVRALLMDQERSLLAQRVIEKEFADQIKITPGDLSNYYEARKGDFMRPERAKISRILAADEAAAKEVMEKLKSGGDFAKLARERSQDEATRAKGGEVAGWVEKGGFIPGVGRSDEADRLIFSTPTGQVAAASVKTDKGFDVIKVMEREPEVQRPFEEVRSEVFRALRGQKEREVQERLLGELRDRYNVVIHASAFGERGEESKVSE